MRTHVAGNEALCHHPLVLHGMMIVDAFMAYLVLT